MDNIKVNQNGFLQIPRGYHLCTTNIGCTILVRNEPLFKEGDVIETTAPIYGNYLAIVDHIGTDGCVCYKVLVHLGSNEVYFNSTHSIIQDNWAKIPIDSLKYKLIVILYENCRNK